jgi:hypothetical protein
LTADKTSIEFKADENYKAVVMKQNIFSRNALRIKLLIIAILTTASLALYKTLLGGYLMGFDPAISAKYSGTSLYSLLFFAFLGFILFYIVVKPFQVFYNLVRRGAAVPENIYARASRISKTIAVFTFSVNFAFYTISSVLMYFFNYYNHVELWIGLRFGIFNLVTNFATAFMAALLQITIMDFILNKYKKHLKIHFLKNEKELKIRSRLLLFTAATIIYLLSFVALPAYNKLDAERRVK